MRLQGAIGRQTRLKRTPHLVFRPDDVDRGADRIEGILRDLNDDAAPDPTKAPVA